MESAAKIQYDSHKDSQSENILDDLREELNSQKRPDSTAVRQSADLPAGVYNAPNDGMGGISNIPRNVDDEEEADDDILKNLGAR